MCNDNIPTVSRTVSDNLLGEDDSMLQQGVITHRAKIFRTLPGETSAGTAWLVPGVPGWLVRQKTGMRPSLKSHSEQWRTCSMITPTFRRDDFIARVCWFCPDGSARASLAQSAHREKRGNTPSPLVLRNPSNVLSL